jgi:uncharacterized protein YndB with AHSA1/START domain
MTASLTLVRRIKAPRHIVFEAVTTAEGIAHWWGPDAGPVLLSESDPRIGGCYRLRFRTLRGTEHECSGEFLVIDPPSRVVMSWRWRGGAEDPGESQIEITLRAISAGTELTFTHSRLHDDSTRRSHEEGWAGSLGKLEAHFARGRESVQVTGHLPRDPGSQGRDYEGSADDLMKSISARSGTGTRRRPG